MLPGPHYRAPPCPDPNLSCSIFMLFKSKFCMFFSFFPSRILAYPPTPPLPNLFKSAFHMQEKTWSIYFIEHNDVQIHPFSWKRRNYILPYVSETLHCLYHIVFIHPSVDGQLGYFHISATLSSAMINKMSLPDRSTVSLFPSRLLLPWS